MASTATTRETALVGATARKTALVGAMFCALSASLGQVNAQENSTRIDPLLQLNGSVEALVQRVSQSVVQVVIRR